MSGADDSVSEQRLIWESAPYRSHSALSLGAVFEHFFNDNLDGRLKEGEVVRTLKFILIVDHGNEAFVVVVFIFARETKL